MCMQGGQEGAVSDLMWPPRGLTRVLYQQFHHGRNLLETYVPEAETQSQGLCVNGSCLNFFRAYRESCPLVAGATGCKSENQPAAVLWSPPGWTQSPPDKGLGTTVPGGTSGPLRALGSALVSQPLPLLVTDDFLISLGRFSHSTAPVSQGGG